MSAAVARFRPGTPPRPLREERVAVYTDLHLRPDRADEVEALVAGLEETRREADAVVVLGDLFDAYVGPEDWGQPAFRPLAEALERLARGGTEVFLVRGNRDVLLEPADAAPVGARVVDQLRVQRGDRAVLLTHGDEFCLRDLRYQRLRRALRRRPLRALLRALPWALRRRLAGGLRARSRAEVARKPLDTLALVEEAVERQLQAVDAGLAIIGHLHVDERRALAGGRRLRILPAWTPGEPAWPVDAILDGNR